MKTKVMLFSLIFVLLTAPIFAQETLLEKANSFYNNDDYAHAKALYLQVLNKGKFSGETLYRYVYSLEMLNGLNSEILDLYAATRFHLGVDGSNDQYEEYCKNKLESNSYDDSKLTWGQSQDVIKNHVKANMPKYSPLQSITSSLASSGRGAIIIFLIIAVIMYLLAYTFSKKTDCIIIWSWWDLIPVAIAGLLFVSYLLVGVDKIQKIQFDVFANVIYFLCIITTFTFSIISNMKYAGLKWPLFSAISILTKVVIMIIIPLVLVLLFIAYNSGKADKRYKDGTKGNARTQMLAIWTSIYMVLIIGLIKTGKKPKEG